MQTKVSGNILTVVKEIGDKNYYGTINAKGESNFLYDLKKHLNNKGFELIKKRMWHDGHLVDDLQQYLTNNNPKSKAPHIYLHNDQWAIDGLNDRWNTRGEVDIAITYDVHEKQSDCREMVKQLLHP